MMLLVDNWPDPSVHWASENEKLLVGKENLLFGQPDGTFIRPSNLDVTQ